MTIFNINIQYFCDKCWCYVCTGRGLEKDEIDNKLTQTDILNKIQIYHEKYECD